jgi:hypothetical protein
MDWREKVPSPEEILDGHANANHTALARDVSEVLLNEAKEVSATISRRVRKVVELDCPTRSPPDGGVVAHHTVDWKPASN